MAAGRRENPHVFVGTDEEVERAFEALTAGLPEADPATYARLVFEPVATFAIWHVSNVATLGLDRECARYSSAGGSMQFDPMAETLLRSFLKQRSGQRWAGNTWMPLSTTKPAVEVYLRRSTRTLRDSPEDTRAPRLLCLDIANLSYQAEHDQQEVEALFLAFLDLAERLVQEQHLTMYAENVDEPWMARIFNRRDGWARQSGLVAMTAMPCFYRRFQLDAEPTLDMEPSDDTEDPDTGSTILAPGPFDHLPPEEREAQEEGYAALRAEVDAEEDEERRLLGAARRAEAAMDDAMARPSGVRSTDLDLFDQHPLEKIAVGAVMRFVQRYALVAAIGCLGPLGFDLLLWAMDPWTLLWLALMGSLALIWLGARMVRTGWARQMEESRQLSAELRQRVRPDLNRDDG